MCEHTCFDIYNGYCLQLSMSLKFLKLNKFVTYFLCNECTFIAFKVLKEAQITNIAAYAYTRKLSYTFSFSCTVEDLVNLVCQKIKFVIQLTRNFGRYK